MMDMVVFSLFLILVYFFFVAGESSIFSYSAVFYLVIVMMLYVVGNHYLYCFNTFMMMDSVSFSMILLSALIVLLMLWSSYSVVLFSDYSWLFNFLLVTLFVVLLVTFSVNSMLCFYFFFEISIIPTLLIIVGWGYQTERMQAGLYFIFYTLMSSLPLLMVIMWVVSTFLSSNFFLLLSQFCLSGVGGFMGLVLGLLGVMAFMVKLPVFFFHLWLPKAHVEAPVAGSMILAGVLLKLGGYGLIKMSGVFDYCLLMVGNYFIGLSLMGMFYVGVLCCRLNDFKALVAYSSVAHMGMAISGFMTFLSWGVLGGFIMMISHGFSSSGLFCIVNMYYERLGSRSFFINKGLLLFFPALGLLMFLLSITNMAAPPSLNLVSEIFLMGGLLGKDLLMVLVFPVGSFLGAVFTLFMYAYSQHGGAYNMSTGFNLSSFREFHLLAIHVLVVNYLIFGFLLFFSNN